MLSTALGEDEAMHEINNYSRPTNASASTLLVHCLFVILVLRHDDHHRNPNINNKDHLMGDLLYK